VLQNQFMKILHIMILTFKMVRV